jgi:hypothetical protein
MNSELWVDIGSNVVMLAVAIYAILDTRKQARRMVLLERNRVYVRVRNDMAWRYIDPTPIAQSSEVAKALEEFIITAQEAEPEWAEADIKAAVEEIALHFADTLVKSGYAKWKTGLNTQEVKERLARFQAGKNRERVNNLLGKKGGPFLA